MRVAFVETMRGSLAAAGAASRPAEFTIEASCDSLMTVILSGRCRLKGVLDAAPFASASACDGELVIWKLRPRIVYRLQCRGDDGADLILAGQKTFDLRRPVETMTTLPMELCDGRGAVLARGSFAFSLRELVPFLVTFLPFAHGRRARSHLRVARLRCLRDALEG